MAAKYGVINEIISDDSLTTKSSAKAKGTALFKEKKNPLFAGTITIPGILPKLHSGMWCSFGTKDKYHNFWIGTVITTISNSDINQKLTLYDGKPAPPSDWIYTPPNDNNLNSCNEKSVSNPQTIWGSCGSVGGHRRKIKERLPLRISARTLVVKTQIKDYHLIRKGLMMVNGLVKHVGQIIVLSVVKKR